MENQFETNLENFTALWNSNNPVELINNFGGSAEFGMNPVTEIKPLVSTKFLEGIFTDDESLFHGLRSKQLSDLNVEPYIGIAKTYISRMLRQLVPSLEFDEAAVFNSKDNAGYRYGEKDSAVSVRVDPTTEIHVFSRHNGKADFYKLTIMRNTGPKFAEAIELYMDDKAKLLRAKRFNTPWTEKINTKLELGRDSEEIIFQSTQDDEFNINSIMAGFLERTKVELAA